MTAQLVVDRVRQQAGASWKTRSADRFHAGSPDAVVSGIGVTFAPSLDVLRRAVAAKRNLIVSREAPFWARNGSAQITPLGVPVGTHLLAAWTGESASTPELVEKYSQARNGYAAKRATFVEASRASVNDFVAGLAQRSLSLAAVAANGALLEQLATDLSLPLFTPRLRQLVEIARAHGAAAKISGAGGGDCGIAFARDAAGAQDLRAAWQAADLAPLDLKICSEGVTVVGG